MNVVTFFSLLQKLSFTFFICILVRIIFANLTFLYQGKKIFNFDRGILIMTENIVQHSFYFYRANVEIY